MDYSDSVDDDEAISVAINWDRNKNDAIFTLKGDDDVSSGGGNDLGSTNAVEDWIVDGLSVNWTYGGLGRDTIQAGSGNDHLFDDYGTDRYLEDAGEDTFYFHRSNAYSTDVILDFTHGSDTLALDLDGGSVQTYMMHLNYSLVIFNGGLNMIHVHGAQAGLLSPSAIVDWDMI